MTSSHEEHPLCHLLSGTFDYVAQFLLLVVAFGGLAYKRHVEQPRRPLKIWSLDVSKQACSGLAAHSCNMVTATLIALDVSNTSPCSWYFVVYMIDSVFGTTLALLFHQMIIRFLRFYITGKYVPLVGDITRERPRQSWQEYIVNCGDYGDPPSLYPWVFQMVEWVLVTIISRFVCGVCIYVFKGSILSKIAREIDDIFAGHPHLLLISVMVMCPVLINLLQAWIQDSFLKLRKRIGDTPKEVEIEHQFQ